MFAITWIQMTLHHFDGPLSQFPQALYFLCPVRVSNGKDLFVWNVVVFFFLPYGRKSKSSLTWTVFFSSCLCQVILQYRYYTNPRSLVNMKDMVIFMIRKVNTATVNLRTFTVALTHPHSPPPRVFLNFELITISATAYYYVTIKKQGHKPRFEPEAHKTKGIGLFL